MNNSTQIPQLDNLKGAREEQKLTVDSVAGMMKVSKDFVTAIESGQFEKLGAPTFLRGHITNYSKALKIDPELILAQIPSQYLEHHQLKSSNAMGASPLARVKRQSNSFGKYAVGTAILAMLYLSFYFVWDKWSLPQDSRQIENITISQDGNADEETITYSSLIPQVTGPKQTTTNSAEQVEPVASEAEVVSEPNEGVGNEIESEGVDLVEPVSGDNGQQAAVDQSLDSSVFQISLDLQEQAWVSIKTEQGENVVHDLLNPGLREFNADEPLKFRLGNAKKLSLSINNQTIDLVPYTNKDVADFEWPLPPNS
ncbi:DUF4115 domain-containing protein [Marinicella sp. S1101]|uniref:helix-turn-helix domain-containing protein n=1 Tax=Marinicella marina TaxID=2996016 RepID=UPI002260FBB3|nr:RodZ domain-containing protein [Marinicella marina]MCX7553781.1 DUF4115 domain-containing protein [Marinicella marina]MDJ1140856.1 DUF4115 domain-containing protein [Marinicella marina]